VFNPLMISIEVDQGVWWSLYDPLWGVDPAAISFRKLAAEIPSTENGRHLRRRLELAGQAARRDQVGTDGTPFTAEDVKFSLELNNNKKFRAARRTGHEFLRDVTVVSPTEITWKMAQPYAPYMSILSWTFNRAEAPRRHAGSEHLATEYRAGRHRAVQMERAAARRSHHPGGQSELLPQGAIPGTRHLQIHPRSDRALHAVPHRRGRCGGHPGITPTITPRRRTCRTAKVVLLGSAFIESIMINLGKPVFQDKAVREALYAAMDRKSIIDAIYYGLPTPTESFYPSRPGRTTRTCR